MRLVAGDGEVGVIAFGTAPVGIIAIGVAPFGVVALGPLATGVVAGSLGGGWVRGVAGGVCGVGLATCWRSLIVGAGVAVGGRNTIVGAGLSIDAMEEQGMALSWSWNAQAPTLANFREWRAWRKRVRDDASVLLADRSTTGVVVADDTSRTTAALSSGGVAIEATPMEVDKVRSAQAWGRKVDLEVQVEESASQGGYRNSTRQRKLRLRRLLTPVTLRFGSIGFWLMIAILAGLSLFTRASFEAGELVGVELGPSWDQPVTSYPSAPSVESHRTMHGALAAGDALLGSGEFSDTYNVQIEAGESVDFQLNSADFDTYLIVRAPDGTQEENDDYGEDETDSSIDYVGAETGTHQVVVTSYESGQSGSYQLILDRGDRPFSVMKGAEVILEEVSGALSASDERMQSGEFRDRFQRSLPVGEPVEIRVESSDFDVYLIVAPPSGGQTDNDDFVGTDAGIDIQSVEEGDYVFTVTSAEPGETGEYVLRFRTWEIDEDEDI